MNPLTEQWQYTARQSASPSKGGIPFYKSFFRGALPIVFLLVVAHSNFDRTAPFSNPEVLPQGLESNGYPDLGSVQEEASKPQEGQWLWVVAKATKSLNVYQYNGLQWIKKKSFPVAYGEREGDKQKKGDLKTPEGNYWVNNMFPGEKRGKRYGALVFSLNFPNKTDREQGKTGAGIWIHGPEFGEGLEATRGCIKLKNKHLLELLKNCRGPIPVAIMSRDIWNTHPSQLDLGWVAEEFPKWENRYRRHSFLSLGWRRALYKTGRELLNRELAWKKVQGRDS